MPQKITQNYELSGWRTVLIFSEQEMADVLRLSRAELRQAITAGHLCYHAHPSSNALREYQFTPDAYDRNVKMWSCIQRGGHHFEFHHYYDERLEKAVYRCRQCPAEKYD